MGEVATRSYRVYQFKPSEARVLAVPRSALSRDAILKSDAAFTTFLEPIGIATFDSSSASIAGDISSLKSAWRKIDGGKIVWGAIGSTGAALSDGEALASARVSSLGSQLDEIDPIVRVDVMPVIPPSLDSTGVDGIIILLVGKRSVTQEETELKVDNSGAGRSNV